MAAMNTLTLALLLVASPALAQSTATLRGIDVYRSAVINAEKATMLFGPRLKEYATLKNTHRPANDDKAEVLRKSLEKEVAAMPGVAFVELTVSEYFTSVDHAMYATFDVVDAADSGRLAFAPLAKKPAADPDGLVAAWKQYYDTGSALARRGEMPLDRPDCPGFYCLWGGATPALDALQKRFVVGAGTKERELRAVLAGDPDGEHRAGALFVLSYGPRGEKVVESCLNALRDPSAAVRGAGLQILADIVVHRKDLRFDADRVTALLDDPSGAVRGKALGLLVPMVDDKAARAKILAAAPRLVDLLKLQQPENHDLAFTVLGLVSKKNFDRRDYVSWESWAAKAAAGKAD